MLSFPLFWRVQRRFAVCLAFASSVHQMFSIFSASCILKLEVCMHKSCDFCESGSFPSSQLQMQLFQPEENPREMLI
jgi:hypothetical protein